MSLTDRRRSTRRHLALDVTLHVGGGGKRLTGRSVDLSKSGIFVNLTESLPEGARVEILIRSDLLNTSLAASGTVVHVLDNFGVGIRFRAQSPQTREKLTAFLERLRKSA